jgi:hypothetical protein
MTAAIIVFIVLFFGVGLTGKLGRLMFFRFVLNIIASFSVFIVFGLLYYWSK